MEYLYLLIPIAVMALMIWVTINLSKKSQEDWKTLKDLQEKFLLIETREELDKFEIEFYEKASKIHNKFITPYLFEIKGSINGMNKILK